MDVKLIVASGKHAGQKISVTVPQFLIGRGEDCQLRPKNDSIAKHHCAIVLGDGKVSVRDFNSPTGTLVNGQRLSGQREVKNGDRLLLGGLEFEVSVNVGLGGAKKPKVRSIKEAAARTLGSAASDDVEIAAWLNEPEAASAFPPAEAQAPPSDLDDVKEQKQVKLFGEKQQAKPTAPSSRDAAADLLRQMRGK